ncbi:MAG: restriction endonuclease subunit S [Leptodesmis sp.]|uniref:restriction endonuclease subunit S n=1 Tax=Leptodesmis sp. TaxID=3100501 RepID=UPI003D12AA8C
MVNYRRFCLSQRVFSIRADRRIIQPVLLFLALASPLGQGELIARQSATTVLGIRQAELRKVRLIVPPLQTQTIASRALDAICQQIDVLESKNTNLRKTRDLLLPKLISGEIDVESLDSATEWRN